MAQNIIPGKYITRSGRVVQLEGEAQEIERRQPGGNITRVRVMTGTIFTQSGKPESQAQWEETLQPNVIAAYVSSPPMEGVPKEHDLVSGPL